jgi:hypothetical protein
MHQNTFSADYSDEEVYDEASPEVPDDHGDDEYEIYEVEDDEPEAEPEIEAVEDPARQPSVEIIVPPVRTFTVPDSDDDSSQEGSSVADISDDDSPVSSPVSPDYRKKPEPAEEFKTATTPTTIPPELASGGKASTETSALPFGGSIPDDGVSHAPEENHSSDVEDYSDEESEGQGPDASASEYVPATQSDCLKPIPDSLGGSGFGSAFQQTLNRAPSPSDAAMVKPLNLGHPLSPHVPLAPPFASLPQIVNGNTTGYSEGPNGTDTQSNLLWAGPQLHTAWAGHNSVLYEPVPQPPPSHFHHVSYPTLNTGHYATEWPPQNTGLNLLGHDPANPWSSRLAYPTQREVAGGSASTKKRKAAYISVDHEELPPVRFSESREVNPEEASDANQLASRAIVSDFDSNPAESVESSEIAITGVEEPPRKKAKKLHTENHERRGNSFIKLAAATVTGIAVGAVGTIIGLATLPQDYFV